MKIRFWGVRGTIPVPGPNTVEAGGNTTCVEVRTSTDYMIVLDAGTGIRNLGKHLAQNTTHEKPVTGTVLFSHLHWDHIQGFPFFAPAFRKENKFIIIGAEPSSELNLTFRDAIVKQLTEPYLPFVQNPYGLRASNFEQGEQNSHTEVDIGLKFVGAMDDRQQDADMLFKRVLPGDMLILPDETFIESGKLLHPGGCLGYRITNKQTTLTYCTDTSHPDGQLHDQVLKLAANTHLLIHDAQYTPEQRNRFPHYGHSSFIEAAQAAKAANADALALTHHDPDATDDQLKEYVRQARQIFERAFIAKEGMELSLPLEEIPEW